jgi:hypothetical protein
VSTVDIDGTSARPLGHRCESCGAEREDLVVGHGCVGRLGAGWLSLRPKGADWGWFGFAVGGTGVRLVARQRVP